MHKTADVVVIGGGLIGSSVAYYLAKKGVKVTVIERNEGLCSGASGANQGGCPLQIFTSPILELVNESLELYKGLPEELNYDLEFQNSGSLVCSVDEGQYPTIEKHYQLLRKKGLTARLIEGEEIRKLEPGLGKDVVVGVEEQYSGIVNPFKVTYGFARAARGLGGEFILSTEVKNIETNKGKITSVVTDRGKIGTNFVVNAAGAWSPGIGKMLGLTIPIRPQRGHIMITEAVPFNKKWRYILDADYITTAFHAEKAAKSNDQRMKLGVAGCYVQADSGNWTVASSRDFVGYNNQVAVQTLSYIADRAIKFMPEFANVNLIRTFAGLRPFCYADGLPILGKVDNPSGFIIVTGHAGEGISLAPITGKLMAELITENKTSMPIDDFSFSRFRTQKNSLV